VTISRSEFNERKRAAAELLRLVHEHNLPAAEWLLDWAQRHAVGTLRATRPEINRVPLLAELAAAPAGGLTCQQLAERTGINTKNVSTTLCAMVAN
jgi:hypothetical protein